MSEGKEHYSYAEYAKKEIAEGFDDLRFGGPIGSWMRQHQDEQLSQWLGNVKGTSILDIGAGTGRTAIPLAMAGAVVTAADASQAMLDVASKKAEAAGTKLDFKACDIMNLPFEDKAFDRVLCFRVLLHVTDWQKAFSEICRCSGDEVIMDFPPRWALAALQVPVRRVRSLWDKTVQTFRLFTLSKIRKEFAVQGFEIIKVEKLWVLPIAFHKVFKSIGFTLGLEKFFRVIGFNALFGAPVTVRARRIKQ